MRVWEWNVQLKSYLLFFFVEIAKKRVLHSIIFKFYFLFFFLSTTLSRVFLFPEKSGFPFFKEILFSISVDTYLEVYKCCVLFLNLIYEIWEEMLSFTRVTLMVIYLLKILYEDCTRSIFRSASCMFSYLEQ